jgi:glycosyltransferase involved in cell wall biosynthesis
VKLSIIFITRNRKHELKRAIDSCIKNEINEMEFVIVDNNSNDGTEKYIKDFLHINNQQYKYFFSEKNLGVAGGRNKAFSLAKGDYVFSLDDDAVIHTEGFFDKICNKMDNNPAIVAAAVNIYEPESEKYLIGKTYNSVGKDYKGARVLSFYGGAHILRRSFFRQVGLYPNNLSFGSEELYPSLLAHKENKIIAYFEDLLVLHIPSSIARVVGKERELNIILNIHIIRKLCYPKITYPVLELFFIIRLLKNGLTQYKSYKEILNLYRLRYDDREVSRINLIRFCQIVKDIGFRDLF